MSCESSIINRVLPNLTSIANFVVRVFALTFREGFLSVRALTKYKLYCTIHKIFKNRAMSRMGLILTKKKRLAMSDDKFYKMMFLSDV